jgi:putative aldouronate transport system permease protein
MLMLNGFKKNIIKCKKNYVLLLMISLPVVYYIIFKYIPIYGILISFFDYNPRLGIWKSEFVGIKYYIDYLTNIYFWKLARNTVVLQGLGLIFGFPIPIILALMINEVRSNTYKKLVQSISYLPHFISIVVVCGMIKNFLSNGGIINSMIARLGGHTIQFLTNAKYFRTIYVSSGIWQGAGWGSIIYIAALTTIDPQLYEAATIDGANRFQKIIHITIPGIISTIIIMLILRIGNMINVGFEKVLLLYTPSTYETADVISTFVYRRSLIHSDYSYGTAVGLFVSIINYLFLWGANKIARNIGSASLW